MNNNKNCIPNLYESIKPVRQTGEKNVSAFSIRQIILNQAKRANVGHIGSALSIVEIFTVLYSKILQISDPDNSDRDRFVLSKGHAALTVYAALYLKGWLTKDDLNTYCGDGTLLGVHPEHELKGIDFSTGSLGQGLSMATGAALAARLQKSNRRIFVLISDAECNEGAIWEAIMFAAHHKLSNLVVIIDYNGQQALGYTQQILDLSPMVNRWRAFGWDTHEVDGNDEKELAETIENLNTLNGVPHVLIAKTVFGKGVSFMENKIKWHYWPMSDNEYQKALYEIEDKRI